MFKFGSAFLLGPFYKYSGSGGLLSSQYGYAILPWQEQAITEVTSHAAQVAASTQAAIVYLNENQGRRFVPEYRDHLTTIADSSDDMTRAVNRFLDYEKTQQRLQDLQNELELGG